MDRLCQHFDYAMVLTMSLLTEDDLLSRHLDRAITMPSGPAMDLDELEDLATDQHKPELLSWPSGKFSYMVCISNSIPPSLYNLNF